MKRSCHNCLVVAVNGWGVLPHHGVILRGTREGENSPQSAGQIGLDGPAVRSIGMLVWTLSREEGGQDDGGTAKGLDVMLG